MIFNRNERMNKMNYIVLYVFGEYSVLLRQYDNKPTFEEPFVVARNLEVENADIGYTNKGGIWCSDSRYFKKLLDAVNFARTAAGGIGFYRLEEICSKAIQKLVEDEPFSAISYLEDEVEMESDELEYFGITFKNTDVYYDDEFLCMSLKGYEEDE